MNRRLSLGHQLVVEGPGRQKSALDKLVWAANSGGLLKVVTVLVIKAAWILLLPIRCD